MHSSLKLTTLARRMRVPALLVPPASSYKIHHWILSQDRAYGSVKNWINGTPKDAISGEVIDKIDPRTGEKAQEIPRSSTEDVDLAVAAASKAFPSWASTSTGERTKLLLRLADTLEANLHEFAMAESADTGKPLKLSKSLDIPRAVDNFRFFAHCLTLFSDQSSVQTAPATAVHFTRRKPLGVVGLISPWNLPAYLLSWKIGPALAMGNTVVAKPSELTPTTAYLIGKAAKEAGIPDGVINIVQGFGHEAGQAIVEHAQTKAISFTGGTTTGRLVAKTAAPLFKKLSLELGGKNPTVVFADSMTKENKENTLQAVLRASYLNSGQICLCGSRIYVESSVYDEFITEFASLVAQLKVGHSDDPTVDLGPVISQTQLDKITAVVDDARNAGAKVLCGGQRKSDSTGFFYEPTVLVNVPNTCRAANEEIFGPVVSIQKFDNESEAIALANATNYGLAASVWTTDIGKAMRVSDALESGMVWVNTWLMRDLRTPFGGVKESGVGREGGTHSLHFFSEEKNITLAYNPTPNSTAISPSPPLPGGTKPRILATSSNNNNHSSKRSIHTAKTNGTYAVSSAPKPVGAYPHARRVGNLLFLSGIGPRHPETNQIPGGPIIDLQTKRPRDYDIRQQTRAVIENIKIVLEACGSSLDKVVDIQCFLVDMDRDFEGFNEVYNEHFAGIQATRTTVAIRALPTPIAVEFKVIALAQ